MSTISEKSLPYIKEEQTKKLYEEVIKIPVVSVNQKDFTLRNTNDPYHPVDVGESIASKISVFLTEETKVKHVPKRLGDWLGEVVENSYDAFAKKGLVEGEFLILKLSIHKAHGKYIVNVKDNSGGFSHKSPGETFRLGDFSPEGKKAEFFIGGEGQGLNNLGEYLTKNNIDLFFKNRKKEQGTTVSMVFLP